MEGGLPVNGIVDLLFLLDVPLLFCEAEYPAACCVGSKHVAKPDPKGKFP